MHYPREVLVMCYLGEVLVMCYLREVLVMCYLGEVLVMLGHVLPWRSVGYVRLCVTLEKCWLC